MSHSRSDRIAAVKTELAEQEKDAFLVTGSANSYYFSGFHTVSDGDYPMVLIPHDGDPQLFVSDLDKDAAAYASTIDLRVPDDGFVDTIVDTLPEDAELVISDTTRVKLYRRLVDDCDVTVDGDLIPGLREQKTDDEIDSIQKAYRATEQAIDTAVQQLDKQERDGLTETRMAGEIEYMMRQNGSQGTAFPTLVATGANASLPHHDTADAAIQDGPVLVDVGAIINRYCADMSRTVHIGEPSDRFREIYGVVKEAQAAAADILAPGVDADAADAAARDVIAEHGYGDSFTHSTGHGVGLNVHESPVLSPSSDAVLEPGMVVTIEPGIYLKGDFGVRIEDAYHITETGVERITTTSRDLAVIDQ
jgi:Xaa-Pro aminopeptidase